VGFTTSRTILHRSKHGLIPGTDVTPDELLAIGDAMGRAGHGVFEIVSDHQGREPERAWLTELATRSGCTVTYALARAPDAPETENIIAMALMTRWSQIFPLGDPPDYEPAPATSVAAAAEREGRSPEAVVLDWLLERDGTALLFAPLASYVDFDHEAIREMM